MIRIGIAGIGAIAENYIGLIVQGKIINCEITALSSRNKEHMEKIKEQYHLTKAILFTDYEEMLESKSIDAVIICTPHFIHPSMAKKAILAGVHPLIEKPVGVYSDEVEELVPLLKEYENVKSGVLYCRRTSSAFSKIKKMVENGAIGELKRANWMITNLYRTEAYHQSSSWRGTYQGEGGGLLMTQASHQLDLFLWICSMPSKVHAFCYTGMERDIEVENDVLIQMEYENGATAQFIASSREYPGTNRLEIIGSKGQLVLENDETLVYRQLSQDERDYSQTTKDYFGKISYSEELYRFDEVDNQIQQAAIVNNFINAIENDEPVICPVEEALDSLYIINAAYLSSWNQEEIHLPLDTVRFRRELTNHY